MSWLPASRAQHRLSAKCWLPRPTCHDQGHPRHLYCSVCLLFSRKFKEANCSKDSEIHSKTNKQTNKDLFYDCCLWGSSSTDSTPTFPGERGRWPELHLELLPHLSWSRMTFHRVNWNPLRHFLSRSTGLVAPPLSRAKSDTTKCQCSQPNYSCSTFSPWVSVCFFLIRTPFKEANTNSDTHWFKKIVQGMNLKTGRDRPPGVIYKAFFLNLPTIYLCEWE